MRQSKKSSRITQLTEYADERAIKHAVLNRGSFATTCRNSAATAREKTNFLNSASRFHSE
jgi:hypothetical protein